VSGVDFNMLASEWGQFSRLSEQFLLVVLTYVNRLMFMQESTANKVTTPTKTDCSSNDSWHTYCWSVSITAEQVVVVSESTSVKSRTSMLDSRVLQ